MAGNLQPLDDKFAIVGPDGRPTLYFIEWAQQRQIDITASITSEQFNILLLEYLLAHQLQEGDGIALTPSGNINDSPSISVRNGTGLNFDGMQNLKIADTAVTPGTYGDATHVGQFTVDQQGRITSAADVAISGGGGGGAWALAGGAYTSPGIWDQAVDGTVANVDFTGLAGASEIMIVTSNYTLSVSTVLISRGSVDNGANFLSASGDYIGISEAGVSANTNAWTLDHITNATASRSGTMMHTLCDISGVPKPAWSPNVLLSNRNLVHMVGGSMAPVNALRIAPSAGGNITAGKVFCFAR